MRKCVNCHKQSNKRLMSIMAVFNVVFMKWIRVDLSSAVNQMVFNMNNSVIVNRFNRCVCFSHVCLYVVVILNNDG